MKPAKLLLPLFLGSVLFLGCAGVKIHEIGIPAHMADNFYFNMEFAAKERGLAAFRNDDILEIRTSEKEKLWYHVGPDQRQIILRVIANTEIDGRKLGKAEIDERQTALKHLSDSLIEDARQRSAANQAFY
jgi:hypothetical protein